MGGIYEEVQGKRKQYTKVKVILKESRERWQTQSDGDKPFLI